MARPENDQPRIDEPGASGIIVPDFSRGPKHEELVRLLPQPQWREYEVINRQRERSRKQRIAIVRESEHGAWNYDFTINVNDVDLAVPAHRDGLIDEVAKMELRLAIGDYHDLVEIGPALDKTALELSEGLGERGIIPLRKGPGIGIYLRHAAAFPELGHALEDLRTGVRLAIQPAFELAHVTTARKLDPR